MFKFFGLIGVNTLIRRHLNDPVNWAAFIRDNDIDAEEQERWIERLKLNQRT